MVVEEASRPLAKALAHQLLSGGLGPFRICQSVSCHTALEQLSALALERLEVRIAKALESPLYQGIPHCPGCGGLTCRGRCG